jgi:hypothetical protein
MHSRQEESKKNIIHIVLLTGWFNPGDMDVEDKLFSAKDDIATVSVQQ